MNTQSALILFIICLVTSALCLALLTIRLRHETKAVSTSDSTGHTRYARSLLAGLMLYGWGVAAYFVWRYNGRWIESDTATISRAIAVMLDQGILLPTQWAYQHGFSYQVITIALLLPTQLTIPILQARVFPYVGAMSLVLASFVFFREVTRDTRAATLASLFLLFQPDVLFVTLRGSHEKFTWPLMMIALMLFYRSIGRPLRTMATYIALFYIVIFAMIVTNVFFSSVFLVAVILSLILGLVLGLFLGHAQTDLKRLIYMSAISGILIFIFIVYLYPLALLNLRLLRTITDQVSALLLNFEISSHPYGYISFGWISPQVYLGLTALTWLLIVASFAEWLRRGREILSGQKELSLAQSMDWLLYAGFATQVAISIIIDFAGVLAANLQLRLFPGFTVIATGLLARGVWQALSSARFRGSIRYVMMGIGGLSIVWFALASILKATNEPALSNKWTFYSSSEEAALLWINTHLNQANIWSGIDERIASLVYSNYAPHAPNSNTYTFGELKSEAVYAFDSEIDRQRSTRLGKQPPGILDWDQIYDNGEVQLHFRPLPTD